MEQNDYLHAWFAGFSEALEQISSADRQKIMVCCGKTCAGAFSLQVYADAWKEADGDLSKCIRTVQEHFSPDVIYEPVEEPGFAANKCFDVLYSHLVKEILDEGYMTRPLLCECLRQSLLYSWETLVGKGNVSVETKQAILEDSASCIFRVTFR